MMTPEELVEARRICDHCCAPFSEVSDEHVSEAMRYFYMALTHIDEQAAEIKRQQAEIWEQNTCSAVVENARAMMDMAAKLVYWQQKAIEERGKVVCAVRLSRVCRYDDIDEATIAETICERDRKQAAREMESESSDHIAEAGKMVRLTDERRAALEGAIAIIEMQQDGWRERGPIDRDLAALRAMLEEGK